MSPHDDLSGDMLRYPSTAEADRLLGGQLPPDELPAEAVSLARLLHELEPDAAIDPFAERRVVSQMMAEIRRNPATESVTSLRRSRKGAPAAKAGALAFAAVLATATAAAAANGSLPPRIQRAVSDALSHVSISVPRPVPHRTTPVESPHGGTDGSPGGGSPVGATGPVSPRGVEHGKDGGTTPRGGTNGKAGGTTGAKGPTGATGPKGNNGRHVGTPSTLPGGSGTNNPNAGSGNNSGQHKGADQGKRKGAGQGKKNGRSSAPTTTVPTNNGNGKGKAKAKGLSNGNAGGNGNVHANGHASPKVSGADNGA